VKAKPFLLGFFAVVVTVAAVSIYVSVTVDKAQKTFATVASPDGKYKAVRLTIRRGGTSPFCLDTISIFLSVYPDNFAEGDKTYEVYAASCARPALRAQLPQIIWLSDRSVQVTYEPSEAVGDAMKLRTKALDASKFVHLTFVRAR
jgi:hypothetical protein